MRSCRQLSGNDVQPLLSKVDTVVCCLVLFGFVDANSHETSNSGQFSRVLVGIRRIHIMATTFVYLDGGRMN